MKERGHLRPFRGCGHYFRSDGQSHPKQPAKRS